MNPAALELAIVYRPVDELIPYARNARTHSKGQARFLVNLSDAPIAREDAG